MNSLGRGVFLAASVLGILALGFVHAAWIGDYDVLAGHRFVWVLIYGGISASVGYAFGLPDQPTLRTRARSSAATAVVSPLLFSVVQVLAGGNLIPRFVVLFSFPVIFLVDVVVASAIASVFRTVSGRDRVIIVGSDETVRRTKEDAEAHLEVPCVIVGSIEPRGSEFESRFLEACAVSLANLVVVGAETLNDRQVVEAVSKAHASGIRIRTLSAFYDHWIGKVPLRELGATAMLFDIREIHHVGYLRLSRLMDLLFAVIGILAFVLILPFVVIGNVLANRGPLFFSQERVGRDQRVFSIRKLRTMRPGPSSGEWTQDGDERITRFGGFLRRSHIDELPQLLNILTGDLSMVGPRPEQPQYVQKLSESIPFYRTRHVVRPGLTGWAQVNYPYGANQEDAYEKLQFELWYLDHQSFALDLRILARTVRQVLGSRGR